MEPSGEKYSFTMAYSKELEAVIEAALADGVLTDKERAVLHKKAQQEGIDPDELDVVIEGRLAKMKREVDWLKPEPPASEKRGNIVKCPNCGAPIQAGAVKCEECGYVFTNVSANHTAEKLANKISSLMEKHANEDQIIQAIMHFPIPMGKEDLIEFIASMDAKRKEQGPLQKAYRTKFKESVIKAKTLFGDDTQLMSMTKELDKFSISNLTKSQKIYGGCAIYLIVSFICSICFSICSSIEDKEASELGLQQFTELSSQLRDTEQAMKNSSYEDFESAINSIIWKDISSDYTYRSKFKDMRDEMLDKHLYNELNAKLDALDAPNASNYKRVESQLLDIIWTRDSYSSKYKDSFLEKKRLKAKEIGGVVIWGDYYGEQKKKPYREFYSVAPDAIKFPESNIKQ